MTGFHPLEMFAVLGRHGVKYVTIGGLAATLYGSPLTTGDVDICPARDAANLRRLSAALIDLDARVYTRSEPDGVAFSREPEALREATAWNLVTRCGRLDLAFLPAGTSGYRDLARSAITVEIDEIDVPVAALADVIRSKEAAGRERDRQALPTLRRLLEIIDSQNTPPRS